MDAVILNYRAGTLPRFASAMRNRLTAVKGKYEIVFTGDDYSFTCRSYHRRSWKFPDQCGCLWNWLHSRMYELWQRR